MMASCAPYNKILFTSGPPSESQSEISSVDSDWSDLRTIALKLGVPDPEDLLTERFKIDRQKLETMMKMDSAAEGLNNAEQFFDNVMKNTSTYISWPRRLKLGAKTKKDPHVRIVGKREDVVRAKGRVLASLDSRGMRVIMKMDVSYTDHSYIIGRGGNNIKRIMEETVTHIHFPDSNRSNPTEKSNQVSLCGTLEGVEKARSLVRLSTPLLISFELPIIAPGRPIPDHETPYIKDVETKYNIQVIFSTRPKLHSSLVLVKGSEKEAARVQEATQHLINFTCENIASQILVHMQLEISPQHHEIVKGKDSTNLLNIMEKTKTKIMFPDLNDMNIKQIKKSQVTITGTIDGVYRARQQLIGNLPITLIFDYPETQADTTKILNLNTKYGVFISVRQKQRQSTMAVVIKGVEKFIDKIYEARHEVLNLSTPMIHPEIPATYLSPKDRDLESAYRRNLPSLLSSSSESPLTPNFPITPSFGSPYKNNNNNNNNNNSNNNNNNNHQHSKYQDTTINISPPTSKFIQLKSFHRAQHQNNNNNNIANNNTINNYLSMPTIPPPPMMRQSLSPRNNSNNTSGYQSFSSSTNSLEQSYPPYNSIPSTSSVHYSPESPLNNDNKGRRMSDGGMQNIAAGGCSSCNGNDYRTPHFNMKQQKAFDFDMKRVLGLKAIERQPQQGELRTPNANWIGLGLNNTSPSHLETGDDIEWIRNHQASPYNLTTGVIDAIPTNRRSQLSQHQDIHSLLASLGLEHYIKIFVLNEIDLDVFTSLTEENLIELGITAFGARKKLLVAIHTLASVAVANSSVVSNTSPIYSGSAAPGAERRTSNGW